MREGTAEITDDALLGGRVRLLQPRRGHRAGTDAVLLAGLADVRPGDRVVDLGAASGAVGLMVAARVADADIVLLERQEDLVALADRNIARNGFDGRARALAFDAFLPDGYAKGEADVVVTNPPWFDGSGRVSPDVGRRAAHVLSGGNLQHWCATAGKLLKPRGRLCLIHRVEALADILAALTPGFGSIGVRPVHAREADEAIRVVVSAIKAARGPLTLSPALVLHDESGAFTPQAARLHAGAGLLGQSACDGQAARSPSP